MVSTSTFSSLHLEGAVKLVLCAPGRGCISQIHEQQGARQTEHAVPSSPHHSLWGARGERGTATPPGKDFHPKEKQRPGGSHGSLRKSTHFMVCFLDGQNKTKKQFKEDNDPRNISTWYTRDHQAAIAGGRLGQFLYKTNQQFKWLLDSLCGIVWSITLNLFCSGCYANRKTVF